MACISPLFGKRTCGDIDHKNYEAINVLKEHCNKSFVKCKHCHCCPVITTHNQDCCQCAHIQSSVMHASRVCAYLSEWKQLAQSLHHSTCQKIKQMCTAQNMNSFVANFEMNYVVDIVDVLKFNFAPYKKICLHRKSVNNIANCDIQTCTRIKSSVYYSRIQNGTWIKHWVHPNVLLSHAQHMHALSENIHKFLKL